MLVVWGDNMIEEIKDELIGKDLDYLIANVDKIIARYEKWEINLQ